MHLNNLLSWIHRFFTRVTEQLRERLQWLNNTLEVGRVPFLPWRVITDILNLSLSILSCYDLFCSFADPIGLPRLLTGRDCSIPVSERLFRHRRANNLVILEPSLPTSTRIRCFINRAFLSGQRVLHVNCPPCVTGPILPYYGCFRTCMAFAMCMTWQFAISAVLVRNPAN